MLRNEVFFIPFLLQFFVFLNILYVTELPEVFWTLGTKLSRVLSFFTLRRDFMDLKKPLTFDEQLDKLIAHGMIVADREKAKDILKRVNYYRFTGYVNVYTHIGFAIQTRTF